MLGVYEYTSGLGERTAMGLCLLHMRKVSDTGAHASLGGFIIALQLGSASFTLVDSVSSFLIWPFSPSLLGPFWFHGTNMEQHVLMLAPWLQAPLTFLLIAVSDTPLACFCCSGRADSSDREAMVLNPVSAVLVEEAGAASVIPLASK